MKDITASPTGAGWQSLLLGRLKQEAKNARLAWATERAQSTGQLNTEKRGRGRGGSWFICAKSTLNASIFDISESQVQ